MASGDGVQERSLCKVFMAVLFHQLEGRLAKELPNIDKEPYSLPSLGTITLYFTEYIRKHIAFVIVQITWPLSFTSLRR